MPMAIGVAIGVRRILLSGLLFLAACSDGQNSAPAAVDFSTWTNPLTGAVVHLPPGWRHSPDTAARGETVIGYFAPRYAWMMGRYGHVSLHHEDLSEAPPSLRDYAARLADYLRADAESITQTVFVRSQGLEKAHFEVETLYKRRRKVLRCMFWTRGDGHFWYAVIEMLAEDRAFIARALPIVDLLVESTAPAPHS